MIQNLQLLLMAMQKFYRQTVRRFRRSLLRTWMKMNQGDRYGRAGFVLPTVTMVLLVVVLLTIAITLRSFDRAKMAQYRRVDEAVLAAATPALDRAGAKLNDLLFQGGQGLLATRETPSEIALYQALVNDQYILPDEERLVIRYDTNNDGSIDPDANNPGKTITELEEITTAWRFPLDTDNNGQYDSFNYYGILFRTPGVDQNDQQRARTPLDARALPLGLTLARGKCADVGTIAGLVSSSGWTKVNGQLKKSFFVYTTTVPITQEDIDNNNLVTGPNNTISYQDYEPYRGTPSFSALEYQQDQTRIPIPNNAVVYEDDLDISSDPPLNLNGRIVTNSNLIMSPRSSNNIRLYQVSAPDSCFYYAENSKITVAGNVVIGLIDANDEKKVQVDLFQPQAVPTEKQELQTSEDSTSNTATEVMYNNAEYEQRIKTLAGPGATDEQIAYFKERTRKVPFAEGTHTPTTQTTPNGELAPDDRSMLPVKNDGIQANGTGLTLQANNLPATQPDQDDPRFEENGEKELGDRIVVGNNLPQKYFFNGAWHGSDDEMEITNAEWTPDTGETRTRTTQVQTLPDLNVIGRDGFWEEQAALHPEKNTDGIGGLRVITGGGVYSRELSFLPPPSPVNYTIHGDTFTVVWPDTMPMSPPFQINSSGTALEPVPDAKVFDNTAKTWGNTLPSPFPKENEKFAKGDLRMRATAVYHYTHDDKNTVATTPVDPQDPSTFPDPIACVSSYYDPTDSRTAKNESSLPWNSDPLGRSNNGIVYDFPTGDYATKLEEQSLYIFPDGRLANPLLRQALKSTQLTLAEKAAIDSTKCALAIANKDVTPVTSAPVLPHGAIREVSFLDARQVKALEPNASSTPNDETFNVTFNSDGSAATPNLPGDYRQPMEDRHPLEVRVTQIDLDALRKQSIAALSGGPDVGGEYILPLSGIVYASRDDALPDRSDPQERLDLDASNKVTDTTASASDFKIDPSRRPNGIMLINGKSLARNPNSSQTDNNSSSGSADVLQEKGLTVVSDLPVYIRGDFNLHTQEEFTTTLDQPTSIADPGWTKFYSRGASLVDPNPPTLNDNFACRPSDTERLPNCGNGDTWRPATVLSDAVTVLTKKDGSTKEGFRFGYRNEGDFDLRNNAGNTFAHSEDTNVGYDLNGNGISNSEKYKETDYRIDLNGDGAFNDEVSEDLITVKGSRQLNGFNPFNDFATNSLSSSAELDIVEDALNPAKAYTTQQLTDESYRTRSVPSGTTEPVNSSYFNNFVTPIQRRGVFSEYVMEVCLKPFVSACGVNDWYVIQGGGTPTKKKAASVIGANVSTLLSGTTAQPPSPEYQRFPRRVAFLRDSSNKLILDGNKPIPLDGNKPIPLGIKTDTTVACYSPTNADVGTGGDTYTCTVWSDSDSTKRPRTIANALWFQTFDTSATKASWDAKYPLWYYDPTPGQQKTVRTDFSSSDYQQPLLVPVLQIHAANQTATTRTNEFPFGENKADLAPNTTWWLQEAASANATPLDCLDVSDTCNTFNLIVGSGDVPARPEEFNGGLQNLVRFVENFGTGNNKKVTNIVGSFLQIGRSKYGTAPYQAMKKNARDQNPWPFGNDKDKAYRTYKTGNSDGRTPFFIAPVRAWGFDVGLLSQALDLFAETFTVKSSRIQPDEYFREVSRDDAWIQGLLCSKRYPATNVNAVNDTYRPGNCPQ
jgi:hypothetical protein